jgi:hypothetical protein
MKRACSHVGKHPTLPVCGIGSAAQLRLILARATTAQRFVDGYQSGHHQGVRLSELILRI